MVQGQNSFHSLSQFTGIVSLLSFSRYRKLFTPDAEERVWVENVVRIILWGSRKTVYGESAQQKQTFFTFLRTPHQFLEDKEKEQLQLQKPAVHRLKSKLRVC